MSLDECRGCGKRVTDFEPGGYENDSAQRGHFACGTLDERQVAIVLENNRAGKAPGCVGCGHLLVMHGAGKCLSPGDACQCPSTNELWDRSLAPEPQEARS